MDNKLPFFQFKSQFLNDDQCLEEIKNIRYPKGIFCRDCEATTSHYKINGRLAYCCKYCRNQVYPLVGTTFEKSTTPLRLWLYAMYLMTQTRAHVSIRTLQKELGVTYKTAWRIYHLAHELMEQNEGDLLKEDKPVSRKWVLFNTFEIKVVHRKESI